MMSNYNYIEGRELRKNTASRPCVCSLLVASLSRCFRTLSVLPVARVPRKASLEMQEPARTESGTAKWCDATPSPSATSGGVEETAQKSAVNVELSTQVLEKLCEGANRFRQNGLALKVCLGELVKTLSIK